MALAFGLGYAKIMGWDKDRRQSFCISSKRGPLEEASVL